MDFKLLAILMFVVLHTSRATNTTELVTTANYPLGNLSQFKQDCPLETTAN